MDERYQAKAIEEKWQQIWADEESFRVTEDPAKPRFFIIQLLRLSGVALVLLGLAILNGVVELPQEAGYVILAVGLADALIMCRTAYGSKDSIALIERWFKRNCKDVLGRECAAGEKADVLAYLMSLK